MVKNKPSFMFCYKFYLIIQKVYEYLNAIPTYKVISKLPICSLSGL
jgi:hypothetical protein